MLTNVSYKQIYIWGCGGHARSVADIILSAKIADEIIFVGDKKTLDEKVLSYKIIAPEEHKNDFPVALGIGNNDERKKVMIKLLNGGAQVVSVISSTAIISKFSKIGEGTIVGHGAFLGPEVNVGSGSIINSRSIIEHESSVGSFSHVAPGTIICGRSHIGDNCFIGAGTIIRDKINICSDVQTGSGSVIVKNILLPGLYVGVPARLIYEK